MNGFENDKEVERVVKHLDDRLCPFCRSQSGWQVLGKEHVGYLSQFKYMTTAACLHCGFVVFFLMENVK